MSPFLNFYNNFICKPYMLQGITYNPCTEGSDGVIILKGLIFRTFDYVEQNGNLKILIGCVWGNGGRERGASCPSITFGYQKGTSPFNF
jgi:hypothetical protein